MLIDCLLMCSLKTIDTYLLFTRKNTSATKETNRRLVEATCFICLLKTSANEHKQHVHSTNTSNKCTHIRLLIKNARTCMIRTTTYILPLHAYFPQHVHATNSGLDKTPRRSGLDKTPRRSGLDKTPRRSGLVA
jgi:hypothetical protein